MALIANCTRTKSPKELLESLRDDVLNTNFIVVSMYNFLFLIIAQESFKNLRESEQSKAVRRVFVAQPCVNVCCAAVRQSVCRSVVVGHIPRCIVTLLYLLSLLRTLLIVCMCVIIVVVCWTIEWHSIYRWRAASTTTQVNTMIIIIIIIINHHHHAILCHMTGIIYEAVYYGDKKRIGSIAGGGRYATHPHITAR